MPEYIEGFLNSKFDDGARQKLTIISCSQRVTLRLKPCLFQPGNKPDICQQNRSGNLRAIHSGACTKALEFPKYTPCFRNCCPMRRSTSLPLLAALCVLLTACAGKTVQPEEYSGFLDDYSQLTPKQLSSGQTVMSWVSPALESKHYSGVYIEPSQFYPQLLPTEREPQSTLNAVTHYYDAALKHELGKVMTIVAAPGPDTLIVRPAIISVTAKTQSLRFYELLPVTLLAAGVSTATGIRDQDSEISTEIAVVDAADQKVLAQVVRKGTGLTLENDKQVMTLDDFKLVLDGWALDMRREYLSSRK
ncbi:DUF3313 domain-containing protein [Pseudomonas kulmbachensis]|uniref:DUF3313 domain-containing protein n=1 Tax=Pseudomonas kulmbachensis TaxID=3043408 RepID=UPI002AAF2358|nr:DUF3313 domain-containing protein [Pseudomonas sp. FLM 004-28]